MRWTRASVSAAPVLRCGRAWPQRGSRCDAGGGRSLPRRQLALESVLLRQALRRDERLDRIELAVGLLVDRDRLQVRVTLAVEREGAEDAALDRQPEQPSGR